MRLSGSLRTDELGAPLLIQIPLETSELCFGNTHLPQEAALLDPVLHPLCATGICSLRVLKTGRRHCKDYNKAAAWALLYLLPSMALKRSWPKGQWQCLTTKSGKDRRSARSFLARSTGEQGQVPAITSLPSTLAATSRSRLQHAIGLLEGAAASCLCSICSARSQDPIPSSPKRTRAQWPPESWYCCMLGNRTWNATSLPKNNSEARATGKYFHPTVETLAWLIRINLFRVIFR